MKKFLAIGLLIACAVSFSAYAAEGKKEKKPLTAEQQEAMKKVLACCDKDKDGKLSKEERAALCDKCKATLKEAGIGGGKK